ncbi:MAG: hypothetical protein R6V19_11705 [Armatimonadota bacterium]
MAARANRLTGWHIALLCAVTAAVFLTLSHLQSRAIEHEAAADQPATTSVRPLSRGYVNIAALMTEHPFYPQLRTIDNQISRLAAAGVPRWDSMWGDRGAGVIALSLPGIPHAETDLFAREYARWQETRGKWRQERTEELASDLKARLRWKERQISARLEEDLRNKSAAEELWLARKEIALVKKYQEALMNASLDARRSGSAEQQGPTLKEKLQTRMEQELQQAREQSEARRQKYWQQRKAESQQAREAARRQVEKEQAERAESSVNSGSKIASQLSNHLSLPEVEDETGRVVVWEPGPFSIYTPVKELRGPDFQKHYGDAAVRVQKALSARREMLLNDIYRETVAAVRTAEMDMNVQVVTELHRDKQTNDLTERFRSYLKQLWGT